MKKWLIVSIALTIPHILEDVGLFFLGRYTDISTCIIIIVVVILGLVLGAIARLSQVRRFLGQ